MSKYMAGGRAKYNKEDYSPSMYSESSCIQQSESSRAYFQPPLLLKTGESNHDSGSRNNYISISSKDRWNSEGLYGNSHKLSSDCETLESKDNSVLTSNQSRNGKGKKIS